MDKETLIILDQVSSVLLNLNKRVDAIEKSVNPMTTDAEYCRHIISNVQQTLTSITIRRNYEENKASN